MNESNVAARKKDGEKSDGCMDRGVVNVCVLRVCMCDWGLGVCD